MASTTHQPSMTLTMLRATMGMTMTVLIAVTTVAMWAVKRTWRRLLPFHWAAWTITAAALLHLADLPWWGDTCIALGAPLAAWAAPASGTEVRAYRTTVTAALATIAVALPHHATIRTTAVFATWCCLILGWPWWRWLRTWQPPVADEPDPEVEDEDALLTEHWANRWQREVVHGSEHRKLCSGTSVASAVRPREHVVDLMIQVPSGSAIAEIARSAPKIDTALRLDEGACGFRRTGKAHLISLTIAERSYIATTVPYDIPVVEDGRVRAMVYADGSPMWWTILDPKLGSLCGLVVGSTGSGKSRALDVIIDGALALGIPVVIGDSQYGQSLPDWKGVVAGYHPGVEETTALIHRVHAEVMERSRILGESGVTVYRQDDPRVIALGLTPLLVVIDECQLVLINGDKAQRETALKAKQTVETCRKTGVSVVLATQVPQLSSLAGIQQIRDAVTAFNCMSLRISNNGSKATIFPSDFVGDPMAIPVETITGERTAGMGYSKGGHRIGMLARTPYIDGAVAAGKAPSVPFRWLVSEEADRPVTVATEADETADAVGTNVAEKLAAMFGVTVGGRRRSGDTTDWIVRTLTAAPQTAAALLSHSDCPVSKPQLYAVLRRLADSGQLIEPQTRGGEWNVAP